MHHHALPLSLALVVAAAACSDDGAADPCADVRCVTAPPARCEGDTKIVHQAVGTCVDGACDYPVAQRQSCAALGDKICQGGQCVDRPIIPCDGVTCFTPPPPDCDGNVARIYAGTGTCDPTIPPAGACRYEIDATLDCGATSTVCRAGACVDPADTPCDPNPCDVPPDGTCSGNVPSVPATTGTCAEGDDGAVCNYALTAAEPCGGATPECRFGRCAAGLGTPTAAGDLVISEIMKNPTLPGDQSEWLELYNASTRALELDGCTLSDDGGESWTVPNVDLFVPAGGYLVLGRSADAGDNGGFEPDIVWDELVLANTADEVIVTCGGVVIDRLAWTMDWPKQTGRAMSLDPVHLDDLENDAITSWCDAPSGYGDKTNAGSPRRQNPDCP
ncbi:MAG: lamin tail domain-containing protein [Deltaproteobacteria bacterium]|nr:lamin tail domain-containing protein [Deltaproteobacteria bacterium]